MGRRKNEDKKVFTVGEIAAIASVTPKTVAKWIDLGTLQGYRVPSPHRKGERRVTATCLVAFLARHQIPHDPKSLLPESETDPGSELTPEQLHEEIEQRAEAIRQGQTV